MSERKSWVRFLMRSTTPEQLEYFKPVFGRRLENEGRFRQSPPPPPSHPTTADDKLVHPDPLKSSPASPD